MALNKMTGFVIHPGSGEVVVTVDILASTAAEAQHHRDFVVALAHASSLALKKPLAVVGDVYPRFGAWVSSVTVTHAEATEESAKSYKETLISTAEAWIHHSSPAESRQKLTPRRSTVQPETIEPRVEHFHKSLTRADMAQLKIPVDAASYFADVADGVPSEMQFWDVDFQKMRSFKVSKPLSGKGKGQRDIKLWGDQWTAIIRVLKPNFIAFHTHEEGYKTVHLEVKVDRFVADGLDLPVQGVVYDRGLDVDSAVKLGLTLMDVTGVNVEDLGSLEASSDKLQIMLSSSTFLDLEAMLTGLERINIPVVNVFFLDCVDMELSQAELIMMDVKNLVEQKKIGHVGVSNASATLIRELHNVQPLTAVKFEFDFSRLGHACVMIKTCQELGIRVVACLPPKMFGGVNDGVKQKFRDIAKKMDHFSVKQIAIAWLHSQFGLVIARARKKEGLKKNLECLSVRFTPRELKLLYDDLISPLIEVAPLEGL